MKSCTSLVLALGVFVSTPGILKAEPRMAEAQATAKPATKSLYDRVGGEKAVRRSLRASFLLRSTPCSWPPVPRPSCRRRSRL